MKKCMIVIAFALSLMCSSIHPAAECDDNLNDYYVTRILFGNNAIKYSSKEETKLLLSALFLCSEQSGGNGLAQLEYVNSKLFWNTQLSKIDIKNSSLMECSHTSWESISSIDKEKQKNRRELLKKAVNKVFGFGTSFFGVNDKKCDDFAAFLYDCHILSDYLSANPDDSKTVLSTNVIPGYSGKAVAIVNGNIPSFTEEEKQTREYFRSYSSLDQYGRGGVAFVNVDKEHLSSSASKSDISAIHPSGWSDIKYENIVNGSGGSLYNRCHLVGHQLDGNDGANNLVTGTRYMNTVGMQKYENDVAQHVRNNDCHVLYRATPIYKGDNKLISGVQLEAYSVEDGGKLSFNVYCYNVQPGIGINYLNGNSYIADVMYGESDVIPFARPNASDNNPDLIFEIKKHMKVIFGNTKNKGIYIQLMTNLDSLASKARQDAGNTGNPARVYTKMKEYEFELMTLLAENVPLLLMNEDFFASAFN